MRITRMMGVRGLSVCAFAAVLGAAATAAGQAAATAQPAQTQKPAPSQKPAPAPPAPPPPAAAATARPFVAIGCVSLQKPAAGGQAATFALTDTRGDKPTVYRLDGDPKELDFHVGHFVEVSGPLSAGTGANANALVMKVNNLIYLAMTCPKN